MVVTAVKFKSKTTGSGGPHGHSALEALTVSQDFMQPTVENVSETILKHPWPDVCSTDGTFDTVQGRNCMMKSQTNSKD